MTASETVSVKIPRRLLAEAKIAAIRQEVSLTKWLTAVIERELKKARKLEQT